MKPQLAKLSSALLEIHRELLLFQASLAEKADNRHYTPYELLNLSLNDPRFVWLKKFSELIIKIDIIVDDKENKPYDPFEIFTEVSALITGESSGISEVYNKAMNSDISLMASLDKVKKALAEVEKTLKQTLN